mmetsp:Transcript_1160/g.3476  ORF Transcript_1160/g.3476 Transcript_1160/m.3476 type:complete len:120 (+) Transcript_1160:164-523(+)
MGTYANHRVHIWHLLSEPTFNATLCPVDDADLLELQRLEDAQRAELSAIRDAPAPTPIGVKPRAEDEDDATASGDRDGEDGDEDGGDESPREDDGEEEEESEEEDEFDDDLGLDDVSEG